MEIKKLLIIGKSDASITMILDGLESNNLFPDIFVYNNLNLPIIDEINNPKFNLEFINSIDDDINLMIGVGNPKLKKQLIQNFNLKTEKFINIIHKSSQISTTSKIKNGTLINSLVSIAAHTFIGNFVRINRNSSIGHHTIIDDYVTINPGCNIAGKIIIGESTTIGMGVNIIDNIKIGRNTIIGAGSVVTKNIPENVIAYGNPCKIIRNND